MLRPTLFHFVLLPFLLGFVPSITAGTLNSFWISFVPLAALWSFGPVSRGRKKIWESPEYQSGGRLLGLLLLIIALPLGSILGVVAVELMFQAPEVF